MIHMYKIQIQYIHMCVHRTLLHKTYIIYTCLYIDQKIVPARGGRWNGCCCRPCGLRCSKKGDKDLLGTDISCKALQKGG